MKKLDSKFNFKLSFYEPEYIVDEENKEVWCTLCYRLNLDGNSKLANAIKRISELYLNDNYNAIVNDFCSTTVARPHPEDEFDKEVGMKVARAKSEVYAYKYMSKLLKKLSNVFTEDLNNMVKYFSEKEQNVVESNTKYIAKF